MNRKSKPTLSQQLAGIILGNVLARPAGVTVSLCPKCQNPSLLTKAGIHHCDVCGYHKSDNLKKR